MSIPINQYPYTNLHELNLDWILSHMKQFEDDISSLKTRMTTAEGNITNLQGRMSAAESYITNLRGRMTTAEGNITNLQGRMNTAEGNITNLRSRMTTAESNITNLQGRMSTAETKLNKIGLVSQNYNNTSSNVIPFNITALSDFDANTDTDTNTNYPYILTVNTDPSLSVNSHCEVNVFFNYLKEMIDYSSIISDYVEVGLNQFTLYFVRKLTGSEVMHMSYDVTGGF